MQARASTEREELTEQLTGARGELASLRLRLQELDAATLALTSQLASSQAATADRDARLATLTAELEQNVSTVVQLRTSLEQLPPSPHAEVYLASACFMGYGLFDQAVLPLGEARTRLGACI